MWIDPLEVSYRIGENGSICVLYEFKEGSSNEPWKPKYYNSNSSKNSQRNPINSNNSSNAPNNAKHSLRNSNNTHNNQNNSNSSPKNSTIC